MDLKVFFVFMICLFPFAAKAQDATGFASWVDIFAQEAMTQGITQATLQNVLPLMIYDESVIDLDRKQPEGKSTFAQYLKNTLPSARVAQARELYPENAPDL